MRNVIRGALAVVLAVGLYVAPAANAAAEKAVCHVCRLMKGEAEPEDAKVWRTYEGERYGFCSKKCASEFDADPAAYVPPSFPRPAPALSMPDLNGNPLTWEGLSGKVVLVDFWATWCVPCRKSMPELQALHDRYAARGFTVVGVSIDEPKSAEKVRKFVASKNITYPIAIDSPKASAWERYRVKAVPSAFLVDGVGRILAQWTGAAAHASELEERLQALLPRAD